MEKKSRETLISRIKIETFFFFYNYRTVIVIVMSYRLNLTSGTDKQQKKIAHLL